MRPPNETGAMASGNRRDAALADCTCIVTGASSGIGRAIGAALSSTGANVCAVARRAGELEAMAAHAHGPGSVTPYPADLSDDNNITALATTIRQREGGADVLVHSAGTISMGPLETAPVADLDRQYRANVRGPYLLTQALLPLLRASRGQIIFINSTAVLAPRADVGQYASTKHALRAIADALREEVNPDGIRVASVYPGRTATPLQARVHASEGRAYAPERLLQPDDVADVVLSILTLARSAEVTDVNVRPMVKP
jgi:NADP-dependent 3-hydroxy acid dehydrogenase YdfG